MARHSILVIEDHEDTRVFLKILLKPYYRVWDVPSAKKGLAIALEKKPHLILLDIMMPEMDGLEACALFKKNPRTSHIPIIFLSAKDTAENIREGLLLGAIDYISKPFDEKELLARIDARIKQPKKNPHILKQGPLCMDPIEHKVTWKTKGKKNKSGKKEETKEVIFLTRAEFEILFTLASQPTCPIDRSTLIQRISKKRKCPHSRTIDVHIRSLRKKIPPLKKHIHIIYGVGYEWLD